MSIYVNRILNLKTIKSIGFDMDHTIVRYQTEKFEELTFGEVLKKLVKTKHYPHDILDIKFNFDLVVRGLVLDRRYGNLLKVGIFGRVKQAFHGTQELDFKSMNKIYRGLVVDLADPNYRAIDTSFSVSEAVLFMKLVDYLDLNKNLPILKHLTYEQLTQDIRSALDLSHRDGSLKGVVAKNLSTYLIQDQDIVSVCEKFYKAGKKLLLITNSDHHYTKALLDYTFNPFLKTVKDWSELFTYVITLAEKPTFFSEQRSFLKVDYAQDSLSIIENQKFLEQPENELKFLQGGSALLLQEKLSVAGDQILYLGDHIYGDILRLKKVCQWRTALVLEEVKTEVSSYEKSQKWEKNISQLMNLKEKWERELNLIQDQHLENPNLPVEVEKMENLQSQINKLNTELVILIEEVQKCFNPYWGEILRAGMEESMLMGQVAKYACIYMSSIGDFLKYPTGHYFRPKRRSLPHETM